MLKTEDSVNHHNNDGGQSAYPQVDSRMHSAHSHNHHQDQQIGANNNQSLYYKKSQKISSRMFREIFDYQENDRNRKDLKKDYRALEQDHRTVKFKHLIDFYLTSSEDFGHALKAVDSTPLLDSLTMQEESESHYSDEGESEQDDDSISQFNEKLVRVICLNQAIDKYQRELDILKQQRDLAVDTLLRKTYSEKLQALLQNVQGQWQTQQASAPAINHELDNGRSSLNIQQHYHQSSNQSLNNGGLGASQANDYDKNLQQIDIKLQNMLQFMNDFAVNFQVNRDQNSYRPSSGNLVRPSSSSYRASQAAQGLLTTQVWPKSRMLFAVVSKMSKEGLLNEQQRGVLKDLILDYDQRLLACLQEYETGGDRDRLYFSFLTLANSHG